MKGCRFTVASQWFDYKQYLNDYTVFCQLQAAVKLSFMNSCTFLSQGSYRFDGAGTSPFAKVRFSPRVEQACSRRTRLLHSRNLPLLPQLHCADYSRCRSLARARLEGGLQQLKFTAGWLVGNRSYPVVIWCFCIILKSIPKDLWANLTMFDCISS